MGFPHPIHDLTFNNKYNVILLTLSKLLDCFKKQDQLFAAHCVWWLASIIQFTEVLIYYRQYKIFLSDYLNNLVVTPLDQCREIINKVPDSDISDLQLDFNLSPELAVNSSMKKLLPSYRNQKQIVQNSISSGRVSKLANLSRKELRKRYPGRSNKQLQTIQESLRKDGLVN